MIAFEYILIKKDNIANNSYHYYKQVLGEITMKPERLTRSQAAKVAIYMQENNVSIMDMAKMVMEAKDGKELMEKLQ